MRRRRNLSVAAPATGGSAGGATAFNRRWPAARATRSLLADEFTSVPAARAPFGLTHSSQVTSADLPTASPFQYRLYLPPCRRRHVARLRRCANQTLWTIRCKLLSLNGCGWRLLSARGC